MIIDTECHVLRFARSYFNNPDNPAYQMNKHFTWHEHGTDLFTTEMDVAGVDKGFLISYDAEDTRWSAEQKGYAMEDFSGGKKYTLNEIRKHSDRFLWFNTVKDPKRYDAAALVRQDAELGMVGIKLFPAYIGVSLLEPGMEAVWDACRDLDLRALVSFETLKPPTTKALEEYLEELDDVVRRYPSVQFALLHTGCADPLTPRANAVFALAQKYPNVYLSTAYPGEVWDDGTEYPFRNYLRRIQRTCEAIGPHRTMWATDWPWFEHVFKYKQAVDAIRLHADFLTEEERALVLGGSAETFMGSRLHDQVRPAGTSGNGLPSRPLAAKTG